jgi:outer membrane immunogenic protein
MNLHRKSPLLAPALLAMILASQARADGVPQPYGATAAACCFTWTGFYYGVYAGAAWNDSSDIRFTGTDTGSLGLGSEIANGTIPSRAKLDWGTSFTGGVQAGYNWQLSKLVLGVEADLQWLNGYANFSTVSTNPVTASAYREMNMLATLRARMGVAVWERSLLYVTGGLAVGDANVRISSSCQSCTNTNVTSAAAGAPTGWALGAGYEAALSERVSLKAEYLHFDLGENQTTVVLDASSMTGKVRDEGNLVRIGVNLRFGQTPQSYK